MTILDTFYLLFKSNADDIKKGAKDAEKAVGELEKKVKDTGDQSVQLGQQFVKMVDSGAAMLASAFTFGTIKSGILDAAEFNRQLGMQAKLMDVNAKEMKTYAYATQLAGGSVEDFQSAMQAAFSNATAAGLPTPKVDEYMRRVRAFVKGMSPSGANAAFDQMGVPMGMRPLLLASDEEFDNYLRKAEQQAAINEELIKSSNEFRESMQSLNQQMDNTYALVGGDVLPALTKMLNVFNELYKSISATRLELYSFYTGLLSLPTGAANLARKALGRAGDVDSETLSKGAETGLLGMIPGASVYNNWDAIKGWYGYLNKPLRESAPAQPKGRYDHKSAMDFWMSQGFTREQAAGIVANEIAESAGNPRARGDGGRAHGLYQWHPDRRAEIYKATGIDISNASAEEQRKAAAWEAQKMGVSDMIRRAKTADEAAAIFTTKFERPANAALRAVERGKMAVDIANSYALNSAGNSYTGGNTSNANVKIDQINVQTQATDASGISAAIGQELNSQIRSAVSNIDDGVAY